ncbi:MAG: hypothetical protein GTO18_20855 [Anaerolineales bacterium]|nr:hypothetical protein [Anaerolineales bacterium]
MFLPPVVHLLPLTTIRRQRDLPVPGRITVHLNQRVRPRDIIAEADVSPRHIIIDVAKSIGVSTQDVSRHLTRDSGERIEKGDVIAERTGFARRTVRAPYDGRVVAITDGKVLFEVRTEPFLLRAGIPGEVVHIQGMSSVTLETTGALIQGVWGNGRQDFGVMRLVGDGPRDRMLTDQLDVKLRGAVLVAGMCDHPAPLQHASELSIRGLILGGLAAELIPTARQLPYPIVVLEGFGPLQINQPTFELLKTSHGREVALDGRPLDFYSNQRPEVIIPLPVVNPVDLPEELIALEEGVRVRVTRAPNHGMIGVVQEILPQAVSYSNGILARSVLVDLDILGSTKVPLANLEIIQ